MSPAAAPAVAAARGTDLRVVLADDTADIRLLVRMALEQAGGFHVVGEAADGRAAIEEVRAQRPDVILVDLAMPRMGGLEALPALRRLCPSATILVLSGFEDQELGPLARAAGADGYLRKGVTPQEIVGRIRMLSGGAPAPRRRAVVPQAGLALSADAVQEAPFGVLMVVQDHDGDRWVSALNESARRIFGPAVASLPVRLRTLAAPIDEAARAVSARSPSDAASTIRMTVAGTGFEVSVHDSGDGVAVILAPTVSHDESDRLRRALATTAHEMRNPVTVLIGAAQALDRGRDELPPDVRLQLFEAIARQARALERGTADLLAASLAGGGRLTVDVRPVDLYPLLRVCADAQPDAGRVEIDGPADLSVLADPGRVEQMVANLVSNAVKYGAPPVSISISANAEQARIEVRDRGPGVSAPFEPHLFDEFTREKGTRAHGTGLGLYVVRSLAQAQQGTAGYDRISDHSAFWISLPLAPPAPPAHSGRP